MSRKEVTARELAEDVDGVLLRVEAGERLRVTLRGRPLAELVPLGERPQFVSWESFMRDIEGWRADPGVARDLAEPVPDATDDVPIT